jgi:hypothetical protein
VQLLIDLGSGYFDLWNYIHLPALSEDGISLFADSLPLEEVTTEIWSKIVAGLKSIRGGERLTSRSRFQSLILKSIPPFLRELCLNTPTLLYRGTTHGFSSSDFHTKCDGSANTLTVIETTKGFIFGGFTPIAWDSTNSNKADNSRKSFVFTIKNPRGSEPRKFALKDASRAIHCHSSRGPSFGNFNDIHIANDCNQNTTSYTRLGTDYENDTGISGTEVFAGEQNFTVKEIEVFTFDR